MPAEKAACHRLARQCRKFLGFSCENGRCEFAGCAAEGGAVSADLRSNRVDKFGEIEVDVEGPQCLGNEGLGSGELKLEGDDVVAPRCRADTHA